MDQDRTDLYTENPVVYCKVNAKNSDDSSVCAEEVKSAYFGEDGSKQERFYEECSCVLQKR